MSSLETITYPKTQDQDSFSSHLCFTFLLTEEYLLYCIEVLTTVTVVFLLDISRKTMYEMFLFYHIVIIF